MRFTFVSVVLTCGLSALPIAVAEPPQNLARGCSYTMTPRPNYPLTTDAGDDRQLTDGVYTSSDPIWLRPSTVGWENASPVTVVIDLRRDQSISGVSYSTAAGAADVQWPRSIFVLVSVDGMHFFPVADLVATSAPPVAAGYARVRFTATDLVTHGRYVALMVDQIGPYAFCDEIEVLAGPQAAARLPLGGESTTDLQEFFVKARMRHSIRRRLSADLDEARRALAESTVAEQVRSQLTREMDQLDAGIDKAPIPDPKTFTTVLPLNDAHARIFAIQGVIAHENGSRELSAWAANPWDFLRPSEKPPLSGVRRAVSIAAMIGETRAGAISISNSTGRPMTVSLSIAGGPGDPQESDLHLSEVIWTDTQELIPVADALVPLSTTNPTIVIPAGMTRQIWMSFLPRHRTPGVYRASFEARTGNVSVVRVPLELTVLAGRFPERLRLHLGGWDYTNTSNTLGLTPNNRPALVAELHALNVDSPWATSAVIPSGSYDADGHLVDRPATSPFDAWTAEWPGASGYFIFVNASNGLGNVRSADAARFSTAIKEWITFWVRHARTRGIQPSQLLLLLVDEPQSPAQDDRIIEWARAIKAAEPDVKIWENPTYQEPGRSTPRSVDVSDVLGLKSWLITQQGPPFVDYYRGRAAQGKELAVYGASGPARVLDPYSYHRLQAWLCADLGAPSSFFWSFSDDAGGHSWNEYGTTKTSYSPFFLSDDHVTKSKHSEAIREGAEDYEYLSLLRERVAALERSDPNRPGLAEAVRVLSSATATVLRSPGAGGERWTSDKDRGVADRVRLALADAIQSLAVNPRD